VITNSNKHAEYASFSGDSVDSRIHWAHIVINGICITQY